jgi:putative ABC transport system substrate-binding protein
MKAPTREKSEMRRIVLIGALIVLLSQGYAEAAERVWRLGVLTLADDSAARSIILPYLATRRFVEGRNLVVDVRGGAEQQMPALAQTLVGDKADVIVAASDWAVHAARAARTTIPIVASPIGTDPVRAGVAESWAHPGGNVTVFV